MPDREGDNHGITNQQGREILGIGGVINTDHKGQTKRPTEAQAERNDEEWVDKTYSGTRLDKNGKLERYTYTVRVKVK